MATGSPSKAGSRAFRRSSFEVTHKVFKGEVLAIEAFEKRVLVGRHPDDPDKLKSAPVPPEIIDEVHAGLKDAIGRIAKRKG